MVGVYDKVQPCAGRCAGLVVFIVRAMPEHQIFTLDRARYPGLTRMADTLRAKHRFAADIVDRGAALFGRDLSLHQIEVLAAK